MKKRIVRAVLALCLLLPLLGITASASGVDDYDSYAMVRSYEELVAALADPDVTDLTIYPCWETIHESGIYEYFTWPEGNVTLDLQPVNTSCRIWLGNGDWTIPENVTVNAYKGLSIGAPTGTGVVINGTWNVMNNQGSIGNVSGSDGNGNTIHYGSVTVNGTMTVAKDLRVTPVTCDTFILNGKIENAGTLYLNNLTMGDGAEIVEIKNPEIKNSLRTVRLSGSITCPEGEAYIGGGLDVSTSTTTESEAILEGNFQVDQINVNSSTSLTIPEGSYVKVGRLVSYPDSWTPVINVNGTLDIVGYENGNHHSFDDNAKMNIGEKGVLKVRAGEDLGSKDSTGVISGTGTIQLYAIMMENNSGYTYWDDKARVFRCDDETPTQVAETVTIWRAWENDPCAHQWGAATVLEATCGTDGYTYCFCDLCGVEKHSNEVRRTNKHTITFEENNEQYVRLNCSVCGNSSVIGIVAENAAWTGQPVEAAVLEGSTEWLETLPEIVYTNNVDVGTATASATFGTITISTTFEIVGCVHEGGTATCMAQAVCTKCSQPYGELAGHVEKTAATCKSKAVCATCGQEYGELGDHVRGEDNVCDLCGNKDCGGNHAYIFVSDAQTHWIECAGCGQAYLEEFGFENKDQVNAYSPYFWLEMVAMAVDGGQGFDEKTLMIWKEQIELRGESFINHTCDENGVCVMCGYGSKTEPTVSGTVSNGSGASIEINGESVQVNEDGSFEIPAEGTFDVAIKKGGCLTYTIKGVSAENGNVELPEVVLVAGDVNEDGKINIQDMGTFRAEFGKTGDAIGNDYTDVNEDGKVNIQDMGTFRANFGKTAEKDCTVEYGA